MSTTYLSIRWSTSRGRDTYGYNICTVTDESTGKRYRCMGGGYDMVGTAFGEWLQDAHQPALMALAHRHAHEPAGMRTAVRDFYGAFVREDGSVLLDGGCGLSSMQRLAQAIGLDLERTFVRSGRSRGETTGWIVTTAGE